jgi:hypothetical protein
MNNWGFFSPTTVYGISVSRIWQGKKTLKISLQAGLLNPVVLDTDPGKEYLLPKGKQISVLLSLSFADMFPTV